jgi:hypothetical protein
MPQMVSRTAVLFLACALVAGTACRSFFRPSTLPAALTDEAFWQLTMDLSEPGGDFTHSENLVSNETRFADLIRLLRPASDVYIGVGPEQNFSYIARIEPAIAFIVDIRRENRNLHLMYKALFEVSADRTDFVFRLFSRVRPDRLSSETTVQNLFAALESAPRAPGSYQINVELVRDRLVTTHRFPLTPDDLAGIERVLHAFYTEGPAINYGRSRADDSPPPSYAALMTGSDMTGVSRSYLATGEAFAFVKHLQVNNLIVPIVGDFAGPKAIRRVGDYVRDRRSVVSAFYGSNVEVYLNSVKMHAHCANLAALPYTSASSFIGSKSIQRFPTKLASCLAPGR